MWLLDGLGNPGSNYEGNRHNVGFMIADALASDYHFPNYSSKHQALFSKGSIAGEDCVICKPQSFMNDSGKPTGQVARFFQIPTEKIIVFYDELDLPLGKIRIKQGGGHGGHNGLKSLDAHLGKDYWRVRFGIEHPGHKERVTGHVLSDFSKQEKPYVDERCNDLSRNLPLFFEQGHEALMTRIALRSSSQ